MSASFQESALAVSRLVFDTTEEGVEEPFSLATGILISTESENPEQEDWTFLVCTKSAVLASHGAFKASFHLRPIDGDSKNWGFNSYDIYESNPELYLEHFNPHVDLVCIQVSSQTHSDSLWDREMTRHPLSLSSLEESNDSLDAGDDVWVFSYPSNGFDSVGNRPVVQKTQIASVWKPTMDKYPHCSVRLNVSHGVNGSPVFSKNADGTFQFVGMVSQESFSQSSSKELGFWSVGGETVVNAGTIADFIWRAARYCEARDAFYKAADRWFKASDAIGSPIEVKIAYAHLQPSPR